MGILPDADLLAMMDNPLAVDIEFVRQGGNIAARAYVATQHADGFPVDVNRTELTLPQVAVPEGTTRSDHLLYNGKFWRISEINPDDSGMVSFILGDLSSPPPPP